MRCAACNSELLENLQFCSQCGAKVGVSEPVVVKPRRREPTLVAEPGSSNAARLVSMSPDGSDGAQYPISGDCVHIGAEHGDIVLGDDPYLSPRHASLEWSAEGWTVTDLGSVNGVYLEIQGKHRLQHRDLLLLGQQVILFETLKDYERDLGPISQHGVLLFGTPDEKPRARLSVVSTEGVARSVYYLCGDEVVVGRDRGDIVMPRDLFMSGTHATLRYEREDESYSLEDAGSSNGTLLRMRAPRLLRHGQKFRMGRNLFRFDVVNAREMV